MPLKAEITHQLNDALGRRFACGLPRCSYYGLLNHQPGALFARADDVHARCDT